MKKLLLVLVVAFAGCAGGNTQPVAVSPGALLPGIVPAHGSGGRLIYASNTYSDSLSFYSYRTGKLEGTTTHGVSEPQGLCSDVKGNVWVTNTGDSEVLEFAHGGTTPIQTLGTTGYYPVGCAVSPQGTLAVSNIESTGGGAGNLMVFAGATGSPASASCPNLARYYSVAYDNHDNLFVDGENGSGAFGLCEVAKGTTTGQAITLNTSPGFPGGVQWDGTYVAILDQDDSSIDRYAISGSSGTLKGVVKLGQETGDDVATFVMNGKNGIVAGSLDEAGIGFWHYPKGGNPYKQFKTISAIDIAISPPKKL